MYFTDFSVPATLNGTPLHVIFDEGYKEQMGLIEDQNPMVTVKDSDVMGVVHGATVVVKSRTFKVREIQPDGTGLTVLQLSAA